MNKIDFAVAEETTVEMTEQQDSELSLFELDMVGGGNVGAIIA